MDITITVQWYMLLPWYEITYAVTEDFGHIDRLYCLQWTRKADGRVSYM